MSPSELYETTLRKLGVLGAGETAESADVAIVTEAFKQLAREMDISLSNVVGGTGLYLAEMLASDLSDDFQLDEMRLQRLLAKRESNRRNVMRIINGGYSTDHTIEAEYF